MIGGGGLALALAPGVPGRGLLERLVVMPLYLTPLLTAMGWDWLASPHSGLLNLLLRTAFGAGFSINAVTPAGTIVVSALATAPLPFLLIADARRIGFQQLINLRGGDVETGRHSEHCGNAEQAYGLHEDKNR